MAIRVVDLLKMIYIDHDYKGVFLVALLVQVMMQTVAVVEHRQRICRYQLVLQMQINKQNNKSTPKAEKRRRQ